MACHEKLDNGFQPIRLSKGPNGSTTSASHDPMEILLDLQRKQEVMYQHILELEHTNSKLLGLLLEKKWMACYPNHITSEPSTMLLPRSPQQPTPPCPNQHQACSYFFRICKPIDLPAGVDDRKVYTPDWYLHHLGFRGSYGLGPTWDTMEIGLHLCFFGADGPDRVQVKVRISVVGDYEEKVMEDWVLSERMAFIDNSKALLASWARGYRVPVSKKVLRDRGFIGTGCLVIRYDVDIVDAVP